MPANFSASLKPLVLLKDDKPCSLKRHFTGCIRQVVGYLDLLAKKDPDRLAWIQVKSIRKNCLNYDKLDAHSKPTLYSVAMIEKALKCLRDTGVLSRNATIPIQQRRNFVVKNCFVVTPHDALCRTEGKACRYVGMGKVQGTRWGAAKGNVWFVGKERDSVVPPSVVFTVGITDGITDASMVASMVAITDEKRPKSAFGDGGGDSVKAVESSELPEVTSDSQKVLPKFAEQTAAPSLCSQSILGSQTNLSNQKLLSSTSDLLTDENLDYGVELESAPIVEEVPAAPRATDAILPTCESISPTLPTVGEYFAGGGVLDLMMDGEFNQGAEKLWKRWDDLEAACREVVEREKATRIEGRRTLSRLVGKVMDELEHKHVGPVNKFQPSKLPWPPGLLKAKEILAEGGDLRSNAPTTQVQFSESAEGRAAWKEFNDSAEGQSYATLDERAVAFDKIWTIRMKFTKEGRERVTTP